MYCYTLQNQKKQQLNIDIMAKPIKETPVLYGRDAERFVKNNRELKKISSEDRKIIQKNYEDLRSIASF